MAKVAIPTVGRQVHYALRRPDGTIVTRPATVVHVWDVQDPLDGPMPLLLLHVSINGLMDISDYEKGFPGSGERTVVVRSHARYSAKGAFETWRWPPFVKPVEVDVQDEP